MTQVAWMTGSSVAGWLVTSLLAEGVSQTVFLAMLGPLAMACGSWIMAERAFRVAPSTLTGLLLGAFAVKAVFFAAYVVVLLRVVRVPPVAFAISFSAYFIALHLIEAMFLKRLFAGGTSS